MSLATRPQAAVRRLNLMSLPNELLSIILTFATSEYSVQEIFTLATVCSLFRDVLLKTPSVWADLKVTFYRGTDMANLVQLIKKWSKRSCALPTTALTLSHDTGFSLFAPLPDGMSSLADFILSGADPRTKHITLSFHGLSLESVTWMKELFTKALGNKDLKPFENIRSLKLRAPCFAMPDDVTTFSQLFPNLDYLHVSFLRIRNGPISPSADWFKHFALPTVRRMTVYIHIYQDICRRHLLPLILSQNPELEILYLDISTWYPHLLTIFRPVTQKRIHTLHLSGHMDAVARQLALVTCPRLTSLTILDAPFMNPLHNGGNLGVVPNILKMVNQSGCKLRVLDLSKSLLSDRQLFDLLRALPSLRRVSISVRGNCDGSVFDMLHERSKTERVLPALKYIVVTVEASYQRLVVKKSGPRVAHGRRKTGKDVLMTRIFHDAPFWRFVQDPRRQGSARRTGFAVLKSATFKVERKLAQAAGKT
ncbi:hypothetical protein CC1G_11397 [Coprinopsis cinerea okayama7|uniref:F-box domain-containing protein n=1 Tax=Coprinopsis cinerea (strain Okayama-7 / 130 / ATCC MYA-4618 / FGSC 9003) TaxID=240176 RepID=A8PGK5_COPC7|nr:hypothetical protein CC1G_11397 [Coprinopsis cinerea okayama7\|eukprot:XP_001841234.1 hypothetical protein CC1G_11397 [Coprinopsis cinerea okayama7\